VGDVLDSQEIVNLPTVTNNVLDLINVMAGVTRQTEGFVLGIQGDFAGVTANNINVMRDGIAVNDQRWDAAGINSATYMNQDMVGEMKMVLAPVDAETGRGNGQIQITTRSGGNEYHGSAVWNIRNSALDARTFNDNRVEGGPPTQPWTNQNQYTLSVGGPIIRNKTFFFALWDQNISKSRESVIGQVLSPCMQRGIFRYWDNWHPGAADDEIEPTGTSPLYPSVDALGNPLRPGENTDGTPYTGDLRHVSLFGQVSGPVTNDCAQMTIGGAPWDPFRTGVDPTYEFLADRAPEGNTYEEAGGGVQLDGLNIIGNRWTRTVDGRDNLFGVGEPNPRKQINTKIDHIFSQDHKVAGSYSYETVNADDTYEGWPDSFEGRLVRKPQVASVNLTSTLSTTMVNEARFGMTRQGTNVLHATDLPGGRGDELRELSPESQGLPVLLQWCTPDPPGPAQPTMSWCGQNGGLIGARGNGPSASTTIDTSPRWTIADTLSWTSGVHSYKFGVTYIRASSKTEISGGNINAQSFPVVFIGEAPLAPNTTFSLNTADGWRELNPDASEGLTVATGNRMEDLLNFMSGSLNRVEMGRFINDPSQVGQAWNDAVGGEVVAVRDLQQREFNFFLKDDWKVTNNLTLNLGLRWDYYSVPYDKNGLALALAGGGDAIFGRSGRGFEGWLNPGERAGDSEFIFVGPNSPNPDLRVYERDLNNWGPAVGFSYSVPWLGRDRTVVRGGYQLSYIGAGNASTISGIIQNPPGSQVEASFLGPGAGEYFDAQDVIDGVGVPVEPTFLPVLPVPVTDRNVNLTVFHPEYVQPYVQNLTASITHTINSRFSFDVKYIGTLTRKLAENLNLNVPSMFQNGLFDAFEAARAGGESDLLDQIFDGIDMRTGGPTRRLVGTDLTGAEFLRVDGRYNNNLADGNYDTIASSISDLNYVSAFNPDLPEVPQNSRGWVLRVNDFPENFIDTNPQFGNATIRTNIGHRNYHSLQSEFTVRPSYGVLTTLSYTWSKNLGRDGGYQIPWDRSADYRLDTNGRQHTFRSYGTYNLPIGPNQMLLGGSTGWMARVVEGWQLSWIYNLTSGLPLNLQSSTMLFSQDFPIQVAPFDLDGDVTWTEGDSAGAYFGEGWELVPDPQCALVAASIQNLCDRNALADADGNLIFRTPSPGERGTFVDQLWGPGRWDLDMAVSKRFQLNESMQMEVRMDATNIFNHPSPAQGNSALPSRSIQNGNFGQFNGKTGSRIFQLRARLDF
jgi:hypothetical protein